MAITLKDIALGNKRMADQPFTSYREGGAQAAKPAGSSINDLKTIAEALKSQQAPDLSEREIESNRILSKIQEDIAYMPKVYKELVDMNKSLKKTMSHIADVLESSSGGGFLSSLFGAGAGAAAAKGLRPVKGGTKAAKAIKYSPKGRFIPKVGTWAGELVKDTRLAGQQLKGIGGKAIDAGVSVTKKASGAAASKWKPFLTWLEKRSPKLFAKVGQRLIAGAAGIGLPGPGWIWTAAVWIGSLSLAYDVYQMWQEYKKTAPAGEDKAPKAEQDAKKPKVLKAKDAPAESTVTKTALSGKLVDGKGDGPITVDGKTYNPGDPGYDEAEKKLKEKLTGVEMDAKGKRLKEQAANYSPLKAKKKPSMISRAMASIKNALGGKSKDDMDIDDTPELSQAEADKYAGAFADGGKIPAGKKGIVGEAGPELVEGPAQVTNGEDFVKKMQEGDAKLRQELEDLRLKRFVSEKLMSKEGFQGKHISDFSAEDQKQIQEAANPDGASVRRAWEISNLLNSDAYKEMMDPQRLKDLGSNLNVAKRMKDRIDSGQAIDPASIENMSTPEEKAASQRLADWGQAKKEEGSLTYKIAHMSSDNDIAKMGYRFGDAKPTNIVNAPTTVNKSSQTNIVKTPVRNQDASYADYQRSKYAS